MTSDVVQFLQKRRSVATKKILPQAPTDDDIETIIACGLRVPDHANVQPWKIVVIQGDFRKAFDDEVILKAAEATSSAPLSDEIKQIESTRMQRSGAVIAVLSSVIEPHKIPVWEQQLSAGAVCCHLLIAAQSLDYAAQWITEWPAYNADVIAALGGNPASDKVAGFIHIGKKQAEPDERKRPLKQEKVEYWKAK